MESSCLLLVLWMGFLSWHLWSPRTRCQRICCRRQRALPATIYGSSLRFSQWTYSDIPSSSESALASECFGFLFEATRPNIPDRRTRYPAEQNPGLAYCSSPWKCCRWLECCSLPHYVRSCWCWFVANVNYWNNLVESIGTDRYYFQRCNSSWTLLDFRRINILGPEEPWFLGRRRLSKLVEHCRNRYRCWSYQLLEGHSTMVQHHSS